MSYERWNVSNHHQSTVCSMTCSKCMHQPHLSRRIMNLEGYGFVIHFRNMTVFLFWKCTNTMVSQWSIYVCIHGNQFVIAWIQMSNYAGKEFQIKFPAYKRWAETVLVSSCSHHWLTGRRNLDGFSSIQSTAFDHFIRVFSFTKTSPIGRSAIESPDYAPVVTPITFAFLLNSSIYWWTKVMELR